MKTKVMIIGRGLLTYGMELNRTDSANFVQYQHHCLKLKTLIKKLAKPNKKVNYNATNLCAKPSSLSVSFELVVVRLDFLYMRMCPYTAAVTIQSRLLFSGCCVLSQIEFNAYRA
ncbi:hypothetical protein GQX74_010441 [Glossina fuscipes]|nr:hypothetical protein GQX74_010441 [Glossina fuscipes]